MNDPNQNNIKGQLLNNINKGDNISNSTNVIDETEIKINYIFYLLGMIIILISYLGPYFYYKIIQKKSFNPQRNTGVKHVI